MLAKLLIGSDENIEKRNMMWNMSGSFLYALASMVLTIAVIQIVGEDEGGVFSFGYSTFGQHMFMVAYFGMRPFQITDTGRKYTFGEYITLRRATAFAALICGAVFVLLNRNTYSSSKMMVIFLMVCYKVIDGYADVYEAEFQRDGRLYITGKSNTFRTILSVGMFLGSLAATHNLVFASCVAVGAQVLGVLLMDVSVINKLAQTDWPVRSGKVKALFLENVVLFLSVILDFYIFSAAKYAIDANMADKFQAAFAAVFMPTSVINLVAGFVIRPFITILSEQWNENRLAEFKKTVMKLAAIIAALTVLAVGGAFFLGIPVISMLYPKLQYLLCDMRMALILIILGGACNAYINLFYYALIIMEKQKFIFGGYVMVTAVAVAVSNPFVRNWGLNGGAGSYLILMGMLAAIFGGLTVAFYLKKKEVFHD